MEKVKVKIGQILKCQSEHIIHLNPENKSIAVKRGDVCIVCADGTIQYLNGQAKGMIQVLNAEQMTIDGYDHESIAEQIILSLKYHIPLEDMMSSYDVEDSEVKEAILKIIKRLLSEVHDEHHS